MATERVSDDFLRVLLIVIGAIVLIPILMMIFIAPMMGMMGWWGGNGMVGGFSPIWRSGMMLVWLIVLIGIGYLLYRGLVGGIGSSVTADPALEELRLAYARGDLSAEEFEERRKKLGHEEER